VPEFTEAGVLLAITYSIREGRRGEFFDLMRELKPLLFAIGGTDVSVYEDRSRPNYLMEVFRFKDEPEFTAFDDKFHKDRKIAAIYALLDDIVEAEKSDFKIFERRLRRPPRTPSRGFGARLLSCPPRLPTVLSGSPCTSSVRASGTSSSTRGGRG
jgi:hypothetical protein